MYQTLASVLKALSLAHPPKTLYVVVHLVDNHLATKMYTMRSTISTVLQTSPYKYFFMFPSSWNDKPSPKEISIYTSCHVERQ